MSKLSDAISRGSELEIDFFMKAITIATQDLEDTVFLVADQIDYVSLQIPRKFQENSKNFSGISNAN